jgi:hypothetical protein
MKEIELTQGKTAVVDDEDFEWISAMGKWHAEKGPNTWYAVKCLPTRHDPKRGTVRMHRLIMGSPLSEIDHWDGNGLHNWRSNLREATRTQNLSNALSRGGSSRYKGVSWYKRDSGWYAQIKTEGKRKHLGRFQSDIEAALAYDDAARLIFGEYAALNFPKAGERSCLSQ